MNRKTVVLGLALLLAGLALAIPAGRAQAADVTGTYGGNLRMAILSAPNWNPLSAGVSDAPIYNLVWDTLARPNPATEKPEPWAAQSWTPDATAKTITVTLRAGLTWSDGTAITAADVAATFGRYGFTVTVSSGQLVFDFAAGGAGRFYTEVLPGWIAWNAAGATKYSGMFARSSSNTSLLLANTHFWAGRPYLDSVALVVASSVDDAACRLLKSHDSAVSGRVNFLGFSLLPNDLSDERMCTAYGGFRDALGNPLGKSLVNANASRAEPPVSSVHNPGPRFLYYWLDLPSAGPLGDAGFRNALYRFVNKQLAEAIEPSSGATNSPISRDNQFWFLPSWEVKVDAGFTAIDGRQDTNPLPGIQALDTAGYIDRDGDGWRDSPAGAPVTIRVGSLAFRNSPDPRKATITGAYVDAIRRQGVNAVHVEFTSWADLRTAEANHQVDVALETYDPGMSNPRWLETFQPILDANDPNTITHLGLGRNAFTLALRQLHFNHVTFYNSECACALPVLHYDTWEVYDRDTFSGYVDMFGGINNVWSFANLKAPPIGTLTVSISSIARSVTSGSSTIVQIVVADSAGVAMPDATVDLSATGGTLSASTGLTSSAGRFQVTWTAPPVTHDTDVTITATVTKRQYAGGVVWTVVTAHAPFQPLEVLVVAGAPIVNASTSTSVQVTVTASGAAVPGASVTLTVALPGGELGAQTGQTDASGVFSTTFKASPSVRSLYRVDVSASKAGYAPGSGAGSVIVNGPAPDPAKFQRVTVALPGFETLAVIAALGAAVFILRWRNRREG